MKFNWKPNNPANIQPTAKLNIGFLAQEVEEVYPELVTDLPIGYRGVNYPQFAPLLLEAIKEQQDIIEKQNVKIKHLESVMHGYSQELMELQEDYDKRLLELREDFVTASAEAALSRPYREKPS